MISSEDIKATLLQMEKELMQKERVADLQSLTPQERFIEDLKKMYRDLFNHHVNLVTYQMCEQHDAEEAIQALSACFRLSQRTVKELQERIERDCKTTPILKIVRGE